MKVTFFSNFINHHEIPFCNALYNLLKSDFVFVQTVEMDQERIQLGWSEALSSLSYVKYAHENAEVYNECIELGETSDIVIIGSAHETFIKKRIQYNLPTFYYAERLFRKSFLRAFYPPSSYKIFKRFIYPGWKSNFFLLAASAYTSYDVDRLFTFKSRRFRWGHFPKNFHYNINELLKGKEHRKLEILWVGRYIELKHPQYAIAIALRLRQEGYDFNLRFIGTGTLEPVLKKQISEYKLVENVELIGQKSPLEVRKLMEKANVFLFTSDFQEGWGAVLNEAMNAGCAIVASHAIGSVPYLIQHEYNGLIYKNGSIDDLYQKVKMLFDNGGLRNKLSTNAYETIDSIWNAQVCANRFYDFCQSLTKHQKPDIYTSGPLSNAPVLKNNWF